MRTQFSALKKRVHHKIFLTIACTIAVLILVYFILYNIALGDKIVTTMMRLLYLSEQDALNLYYSMRWRFESSFIAVLFVVAFAISIAIGFHQFMDEFLLYMYQTKRNIIALRKNRPFTASNANDPIAAELKQLKLELEQKNQALQFAEKQKRDMIVYLAHDLKTPLTSILGYVTLLNDEPNAPEAIKRKYLAITMKKAEQLDDLINEFFDVTRLNLSECAMEYSTVSLKRLLEQTCYEFEVMLRQKNLTYAIVMPVDIPLHCDVNQMQRVFDNILRNAIHYSYANTEITVRAQQTSSGITIQIANHGPTVSKEQLNHIFHQFFRLETSQAMNAQGAGLGLAIAKKIVTMHKGTICATSENEQICFTVTLPLS